MIQSKALSVQGAWYTTRIRRSGGVGLLGEIVCSGGTY